MKLGSQVKVEANRFASELLMPECLVKQYLKRRAGVDIEHALQLASRFQVSKEAAARRYVDYCEEPVAIVFSKDRVIRYAKKSKLFPALASKAGEPLPNYSLSIKCCDPIGQVSAWDELDAGIWLREPKGRRVCEQTLAQQNGFRLTLIALAEESDEDDDEKPLWKPPYFHR